MKILIIDNYDSFTCNLRQIVEEFHYEYSVMKNDQLTLEHAGLYSKILISPGPGLPSEAGIIKKLILEYASTKQILGICLGHQAIAEVFGGELFNFPVVRHGVTTEVGITDTKEYLFENIPSDFEAGLYHSWAVSQINFPECLKITSISHDNVIMSLSHKTYDVKGVQFHPESIMTEFGNQLIRNWLEH